MSGLAGFVLCAVQAFRPARKADLKVCTTFVACLLCASLAAAQEIPGGRSRDFEDPNGYVFELVELTPPP